jgi:hypothetical protein
MQRDPVVLVVLSHIYQSQIHLFADFLQYLIEKCLTEKSIGTPDSRERIRSGKVVIKTS